MKPKLLLRIAASLIFIHSVLHTIGMSTWKDTTDPVEKTVVDQMTGHKFPFMGAIHSLGENFDGFGYACTIALFLIAAILWVVSGEIGQRTGLVKKVVFIVAVSLIAWGVDELIFFFPFAAIITLTAAALTLISGFMVNKKPDF